MIIPEGKKERKKGKKKERKTETKNPAQLYRDPLYSVKAPKKEFPPNRGSR